MTSEADSSDGPRGRGKRAPRRGAGPGRNGDVLWAVKRAFYACGRCSAFLAGYQALHGPDVVAEAAQAGERWLTLPWSVPTRELVHKAMGGRIDIAAEYYMLACPECTRAYLYQAEEGAEATFQVEIKPRSRR